MRIKSDNDKKIDKHPKISSFFVLPVTKSSPACSDSLVVTIDTREEPVSGDASSNSGKPATSGRSICARHQRREKKKQRLRAAKQGIDPGPDSKTSESSPIITDHLTSQKVSSSSTKDHLAKTRKPMQVHPMPWKLIPITLPHFAPFTHAGPEDPWEMSLGETVDSCTQSGVEKLRENFQNFISILEEEARLKKSTPSVISQLQKPLKKGIANLEATEPMVQGSDVKCSDVRTAAVYLKTNSISQPTYPSEKTHEISASESSRPRKHSIVTNLTKVHVHSKLEVEEKCHKLTATKNMEKKPFRNGIGNPVPTKPLVQSREFNFSEVRTTSVSLDSKPNSQPTKPLEKKQDTSVSESSSPRKVHVKRATPKQLEVLRNIKFGKKFYVKDSSVSVSPKVSPQKDFLTKQTHKGPLEMLGEKFVGKTFALGKKVMTTNLIGNSPSKNVPAKSLSTNILSNHQEKSASKIIDKGKTPLTADSEADRHKKFLLSQQPTKSCVKSPKISFKQRLERYGALEGSTAKDYPAKQVPTKPVGISRKTSYDQRFGEEEKSTKVNIDVSPTKVITSKKVPSKPLAKSRKISNDQTVSGHVAQLNLEKRSAKDYAAEQTHRKLLGKSQKTSLDQRLAKGKYSSSTDTEISPAKDFLPMRRPTKPTEVARKMTSTFAEKSGKEKSSATLNSEESTRKYVSTKTVPTETPPQTKLKKMSIDKSFNEVENCLTADVETNPPTDLYAERTTTIPKENSEKITSRQLEENKDFPSKRLPTRPAKMSRKISVSGRLNEGRKSVADNVEDQSPSEVVLAKQNSIEPLEKQQSPFNNCFDNNENSVLVNVEETVHLEMSSSIQKCEDGQYIRDVLRHMQELQDFRSLVDLQDELDDLENELKQDFDNCYERFVEKYNVIPHY